MRVCNFEHEEYTTTQKSTQGVDLTVNEAKKWLYPEEDF